MTPTSPTLSASVCLLLLAGCAAQQSWDDRPSTIPTTGPDAPVTTLAGPAYTIQIHRPSHPGDAYELHCLTEVPVISTIESSSPPQIDKKTDTTELICRIDIRAINPGGQPTDFTATIHTLTGSNGEPSSSPPGRVIEFHRTPKALTYSLHNGPLNTDAQTALHAFFDNDNTPNESDDKIFGSPTPHRVGDTWPINAPAAAAAAAKNDPNQPLALIHGHTTLLASQSINGLPALRITATMSAKIKVNNIPFGLHVDRADMQRNLSLLAPADPTLPLIEEQDDSETTIAMSGSALFIPFKLDMTIRQRQTISPIQKYPPPRPLPFLTLHTLLTFLTP